jgi:tetratricopeptide (TPR) repeat protein
VNRRVLISFYRCVVAALVCVTSNALNGIAYAQHSSEVQRFAMNAEYFKALATYQRMAKRTVTVPAAIAAAKSAWALGLPQFAEQEFQKVLHAQEENSELSAIERAKIHLVQGVMQLQEEHPEVAVVYAQKGMELLTEASPLRSQLLGLWGESLAAMQRYPEASHYYQSARDEAVTIDQPDFAFSAAECHLAVGRYNEARELLETIPVFHDHGVEALRLITRIALETKQYDDVIAWVKKGRELFPDAFADAWSYYALTIAGIETENRDLVESANAEAMKHLPPSDMWLTLLNAAAEIYRWKIRQPEDAQ